MSDLHLSLIVFGLLVIVGVVVYNWIQEQKFRKIAQQRFRSAREDTLMDTGQAAGPNTLARQTVNDMRIEPRVSNSDVTPHFADDEADSSVTAQPEFDTQNTQDSEAADRIEHARGAVPAAPPVAASSSVGLAAMNKAPGATHKPAGTLPPPLDLAIDYIARLDFAEAVSAAALREAVGEQHHAKTVYWRGLSATGQWEDVLQARERLEFTAVIAGMQLADRAGAVSSEELSQFTQQVQRIAERLIAVAQLPERQGALEHAQKLDQFCAEVDILVGVNVVALDQGSFPGTKIRALAEAAGFKLTAEGSYQYLDDHGVSLYSLSNQESAAFSPDEMKQLTTHGLTLLFDVPRVPHGLRAFEQMILFARQLSESLHGMMVDDNLRPLSDEGVSKIKQQLSMIYGKMDKNGIAAGSSRAQRLFS